MNTITTLERRFPKAAIARVACPVLDTLWFDCLGVKRPYIAAYADLMVDSGMMDALYSLRTAKQGEVESKLRNINVNMVLDGGITFCEAALALQQFATALYEILALRNNRAQQEMLVVVPVNVLALALCLCGHYMKDASDPDNSVYSCLRRFSKRIPSLTIMSFDTLSTVTPTLTAAQVRELSTKLDGVSDAVIDEVLRIAKT